MTSNIEQKLKRSVENGEVELPMLPAVATRVMELTRDPDSSATDLAKLLQSDQSLAGHVMRVANSAAYASVGQLQTLQQAITRLGMQQISQMALTTMVGEVLFKPDPETAAYTDSLWRHSLATGAWAREIARLLRDNTEVCFLSGLLHEIGKPVALHAINRLLDSNAGDDGASGDRVALDDMLVLVDHYHKVLGVSLARRWQLPEPVIESINYIDDYFAAPSARSIVTIVNAAKQIAEVFLMERDSDEPFSIQSIESPVFVELNLYAEDLEVLDEKIESVNGLIESMVI